MNPTYTEIPVTFEKGLVLEYEESLLDVGQASEALNWTPEPNGGLRSRNRWKSLSTTGLPATRRMRGFGTVGISAQPYVVQWVSTGGPNTSNPDTTQEVTLTDVTPGNRLVAMYSYETTDPVTDSMGYDEDGSVTGTTGREHEIRSTIADSSTETYTLTVVTGAAGSRSWLTLVEAANIGPIENTPTAQNDTDTSFSPSVTALTDLGIAFSEYHGEGLTDNEPVSYAWTALDDINMSDPGTSLFAALRSYTQYVAVGSVTQTFTNADASNLQTAYIALYPAINRDQRDFYLVAALADDAIPLEELPAVESITGLQNVTDGTSYTTASVSPSAAGVFLVAVISTTKASAPDTVTGVAGTNAFDTTWTFRATRVSAGDTRRISVFTAVAQSTTAGTVTATIGGTALSGVIQLFEIPASAVDVDDPFVQSAVSVGNSDSILVNLAAFAKANNWPILVVVNNVATANIEPGGALVQINETAANDATGNADQSQFAAYDYTPDTSLTATGTSADWAAIGLEVNHPESELGYSIYRILRDQSDTGEWELIDSRGGCSDNDALVSFAQGAGTLNWSATSMPYQRKLTLASLLGEDVTDLANPGRSLAYHKDRLFSSGSTNEPQRLYYSDLASPSSFPANNFVDVGGSDGEAIEGLVSVENLLLIAKTNRIYLMSGSGIESFFFSELAGGTAATGMPAVRTPYGTIVAGANDVWVVQGGGIDPLARPLGSEYAISGSVTAGYAQDMALIADSATGILWRVNLVTGSWSQEQVESGADDVHIIFSQGGRLWYGVESSTTQAGGVRRPTFERTYDETTGETTYAAATGRLSMFGPMMKYTPRALFLQLRSHDTSLPGVLEITIESDRGSEERSVEVTTATDRRRIDLGKYRGVEWIKFSLANMSGAGRASIDVEKSVMGVIAEENRA